MKGLLLKGHVNLLGPARLQGVDWCRWQKRVPYERTQVPVVSRPYTESSRPRESPKRLAFEEGLSIWMAASTDTKPQQIDRLLAVVSSLSAVPSVLMWTCVRSRYNFVVDFSGMQIGHAMRFVGYGCIHYTVYPLHGTAGDVSTLFTNLRFRYRLPQPTEWSGGGGTLMVQYDASGKVLSSCTGTSKSLLGNPDRT